MVKHEDIDKLLQNSYRDLLKVCSEEYDAKGLKLVRKSFEFLQKHVCTLEDNEARQIIKLSVELAQMVTLELGLDPLGTSAALVVPLTNASNEIFNKVEKSLGSRVWIILQELRKITALDTVATDKHSENMRNLILSLSTDFRVILIKIAEKLYFLRILKNKDNKESIAAASEAKSIYSPLAHRLGLYNMMSEMEDIALRILEKDIYIEISKKLSVTKAKREKFVKDFIAPLEDGLVGEKLKFRILGRPKSISSIWRKMKKQNVDFEEVYDKFAIRIILSSTEKKEKSDCWRTYSVVTDLYQPNPDRLRDWISMPKSNGYESLHTTVVVSGGDWVEIQIRSERMNEIAEKGLAAHWKYKGIKGQAGVDEWLGKVREALDQSEEEDSANLIDDLKLSQFSQEIFVFTPGGDLKKFPENATVLDFAYDIHTEVGSSCMGAKINGKIVPIRHKLHNGDKVEIIQAKNQKAKMDWLNFVSTSKAKGKIRQALKETKLKEAENGKEILKRRFKNWKIEYNDSNVRKVIEHFNYKDSIDLHFDIAVEKIDLLDIKEIFAPKDDAVPDHKAIPIENESVEKLIRNVVRQTEDFLVIDEKISNIDYKLSKCCSPIMGDSIFGFVTRTAGISIHRMNCPNAQQLLTKYGYRVVKAQWTTTDEETRFSVTILITGLDDIGIVSNISDVISKDLQVNMRSLSIDSNDGMFEGTITLFVKDTQHLEALIRKLKRIKGISNVRRIDV
jgi:GTP diphosphokinase / guanosine-3',5'-bis(diphosphate) 3'-diphosphatase